MGKVLKRTSFMLTEAHEEFLEELVMRGLYSSKGEVIRRAITDLMLSYYGHKRPRPI